MGDINLGTKLKNLNEDVNTKIDEVSSVIADNGDWLKSKNLLNPKLETTTLNGVTCTNNGDGTYTLNGTATNSAFFTINNNITYKANKKYRLVGCPIYSGNFDDCPVAIKYDNSSGWGEQYVEYGKGLTILLNSDLTTEIAIVARNGKTYNNMVIKPMLVDADLYPDVTYDDFESYTKSNVELASDLATLIETLKSKGVID